MMGETVGTILTGPNRLLVTEYGGNESFTQARHTEEWVQINHQSPSTQNMVDEHYPVGHSVHLWWEVTNSTSKKHFPFTQTR